MYQEDAFITTLLNIAKALTSARNLPAVLNYVVSSIANLFRAKACSIRLINEANKTLELAAAFGLSDHYLKKGPVEIEKSLVDKEALEGATVFIRDVTKDIRWQYPEEAKREGIVSVMVAPLVVKKKKVGVIRVYLDRPHKFSSSEQQFLKAIARHASIALENARLYELALKNYDQLVQEVWQGLPDVWGTVVGAK
jgi:GAF domain-containing protein